jgi:hypothetical protein
MVRHQGLEPRTPLIGRRRTSTSSALYQHLWQHSRPLGTCDTSGFTPSSCPRTMPHRPHADFEEVRQSQTP